LSGAGANSGLLVEDAVGGLAHRLVADDAAAAGVDQRLARAGEGGDQRLDGTAVVAAGGVDDGVGGPRLAGEHGGVVQGAEHRLDADRAHRLGLGRVAHQPADAVAGGGQPRAHRAADEAAGAGEKNHHPWASAREVCRCA
jgi:hypothetical protein